MCGYTRDQDFAKPAPCAQQSSDCDAVMLQFDRLTSLKHLPPARIAALGPPRHRRAVRRPDDWMGCGACRGRVMTDEKSSSDLTCVKKVTGEEDGEGSDGSIATV